MIQFPNAKINLGLQLVEKRPDGFHNLLSCFYPVGWTDALEILPTEGEASFTLSGLPVPGAPTANLCWKAYQLLRRDFALPAIQMHLHKVIPMGAGLGGGSADAAFTLKILNQLFALQLTEEALEDYARQLGSDCAFFIRNQPVLAVEKGDVFETVPLDLVGWHLVLVYPNLVISTAEAYAGVSPRFPENDLKTMLAQEVATWRDRVVNDFEHSLFPKYPVLGQVKAQLYEMGAVYASMSGSGSTMYGLFKAAPPQPLPFPAEYSVWQGIL
ncbi:4-(cytidine 5'-diphospho)-2-C-methyl-D-erythritol kinase [Rufibacter glacialis]|uniref:4-diphosphocytidyl-2-C-methyl-D-erythritol kinase n=1 Tax=Rufibacter glacialis TaxID=1259555 RepID=A0A5M8QHA8_9BACT|nr:4-(cytidine 5'-diphospho)-2-C-methyl-D-erythritol kinase [Rufibacter glacialis]KAA6435467.1 4-(cytidine 5'-diphospho)-2-C-methyl-D-erythritol kinase [Rufibacter glacialis]GGK63686.1 4-diphosphocytidyl-2-C-methyl-D-erythritol kinase [Rufibacter glacialis]